jgi:hypothetical protein
MASRRMAPEPLLHLGPCPHVLATCATRRLARRKPMSYQQPHRCLCIPGTTVLHSIVYALRMRYCHGWSSIN